MPMRILMTPKQAAEYLQLSMSTLAKMRMRGDGPPYNKTGPKAVRYRIAELDAWLEERLIQSTSENDLLES
jgi:excisionase family DNA binding protein